MSDVLKNLTIDKDRIVVWIVFALQSDGSHTIVAICTNQPLADRYRSYVQQGIDEEAGGFYKNALRVWVEKSITDHFIAETMMTKDLDKLQKFWAETKL